MTPGVINYEDCAKGGQELLRKETIDSYLQTLVGYPLTIGHIDTKMTSFEDVSHGTVDKVGFDSDKGWHFCEGPIETDNARNCIKEGWGVSVGMRALEFGPGGMWLNNPYDREMKRIKFHHLALVEPGMKPRIDQSEIRLNSTAKKPMNIVTIIKKKLGLNGAAGTETKSELALATKLDIGGGKSVTLAELIESERNNHCHAVGAEDYIEHEGVRFHCGTLISNFKERMNTGHHPGNTGEVRVNTAETPEAKASREVVEAAAAVKTTKTALDAADAEFERVNSIKESTDDQKTAAKTAADSAKTAYDAAFAKGTEATDRFNSLKTVNAEETKRLADEKIAADKKLEVERQNAATVKAEEEERQNAQRRAGAESFAILSTAQEHASRPVYRTPSGNLASKLALGRKLCGSNRQAEISAGKN